MEQNRRQNRSKAIWGYGPSERNQTYLDFLFPSSNAKNNLYFILSTDQQPTIANIGLT